MISKSNNRMEKTYVIILIILLGGVAQYNISDGDGISQQYLHKLNIGVFAFSPLKIVRSGYICEILKNLLIIINLTRA